MVGNEVAYQTIIRKNVFLTADNILKRINQSICIQKCCISIKALRA